MLNATSRAPTVPDCPTGGGLSETQYQPISVWNPAITQCNGVRREFTRKASELAELVRQNATVAADFSTVRRTPIDVRNKLRALGEKLTTPQVEQIAAKYRIRLYRTHAGQCSRFSGTMRLVSASVAS